MNAFLVIAISFCALCSVSNAGIGRKQKVKIHGQVFCPSSPKSAQGIRVRLMEEDVGFDDHMGETKTDNEGKFVIEGEESETTNIDARIKFYHKCDHYAPCLRKWVIKIPDRYINKGEMDLGRMNLEMRLKDEERDCV